MLEVAIGKLSLTERHVSFGDFNRAPLSHLLDVCGQTAPVKLIDIFSKYWFCFHLVKGKEDIIKALGSVLNRNRFQTEKS